MFNHVTNTEWAYAAGIIDGEGSIGIKRTAGRGLTTYVKVSNTEKPLLDWLIEKFGGQLDRQIAARNKNQRPYYVWNISAIQHINFLSKLIPFLTIKKRRAELMIEARSTINPGNSQPLSAETHAIRQKLYDEFKTLNGRGVFQKPTKNYW